MNIYFRCHSFNQSINHPITIAKKGTTYKSDVVISFENGNLVKISQQALGLWAKVLEGM